MERRTGLRAEPWGILNNEEPAKEKKKKRNNSNEKPSEEDVSVGGGGRVGRVVIKCATCHGWFSRRGTRGPVVVSTRRSSSQGKGEGNP